MAEEAAASPQDIRVHFSSWVSAEDGTAVNRNVVLPVGASLGALLRHLSSELGVDLVAATGHDGNAFIVVNETHWAVPEDLNRSLQDGDVVLLMPFIAGG
jgi:molybdopterin converting factor small subunit